MKVITRLAVAVSASMLTMGVAMADGPDHGKMMGKGEKCEHHDAMHGGANSASMARSEKRLGDLKTKLKLTKEQEPAWAAFSDKMKTESKSMAETREKMWQEKPGTSPERLAKAADAMKERAQAMADMAATVKTFYDTLTAEQKTTFDKTHQNYKYKK
jgi:hypothetical protein